MSRAYSFIFSCHKLSLTYFLIGISFFADDFTDDEKLILLGLPKQEYLLDATENRTVMLGLLDILFAYCYDFHVTMGETSVESSWNIAILSSTLSWFDVSFNSECHDEVIYLQSLENDYCFVGVWGCV